MASSGNEGDQVGRSAGAPAVVRVGVLGAGNVGKALLSLLLEEAQSIEGRTGVRLELAGVAVAHPSRPRSSIPAELLTGDAKGLVTDPSVDVVVELIGGLEPARSLLEAAIGAGKPVVTANKELIAEHGAKLATSAASAGVDLFYEAAVAGAIPIIRPLRESLAGEKLRRVMGIVNGTTNFILTTMSEEGHSYTQALAEAQRLGLAERDPTADVDGYDAAAKAAILASLAFGCEVVSSDVAREGISSVDPVDVDFAGRLGYVVKLLAVAERIDAGTAAGQDAKEISVRVHPAMLPRTHPLASVRGAFNAVFVEGEAAGQLMLYGSGAGGRPTASAVLGDLIDAAHHLRAGFSARPTPRTRVRMHPADDLRSAWYLNIDVADRPGVLASVASVFGEHAVSIRSMEQVGMGNEARLIFVTHVARQGDLMRTLDGLGRLEVVDRIGGVLRIVGDEEA
jgi:homoserine dehydrogenase